MTTTNNNTISNSSTNDITLKNDNCVIQHSTSDNDIIQQEYSATQNGIQSKEPRYNSNTQAFSLPGSSRKDFLI